MQRSRFSEEQIIGILKEHPPVSILMADAHQAFPKFLGEGKRPAPPLCTTIEEIERAEVEAGHEYQIRHRCHQRGLVRDLASAARPSNGYS